MAADHDRRPRPEARTVCEKAVVLGQGYVGLPLALRAVAAGHDVIGFDVDEERVACLHVCESYIDDISDDDMRQAFDSGPLGRVDGRRVDGGVQRGGDRRADPVARGSPDLRFIESAGAMMAPHVRTESCVILESTTFPSTTVDILLPILQAGCGLRGGADFFVGYSSEPIGPGDLRWQQHNTTKIVSDLNSASFAAVDEFFSTIVERTIPLPGLEKAELAKLLENTFSARQHRARQRAGDRRARTGRLCLVRNRRSGDEAIRVHEFTPGPGVGGHWLPIDPSYLSRQARQALGQSFRFVELANNVNEHVRNFVARRVAEHLNRRRLAVNGAKIWLIGFAYKADSGDARESPAVAARMQRFDAELTAVDPMVDERHVPKYVEPIEMTGASLDDADVIVVLTDHSELDWTAIGDGAAKVLDTRLRLAQNETDLS